MLGIESWIISLSLPFLCALALLFAPARNRWIASSVFLLSLFCPVLLSAIHWGASDYIAVEKLVGWIGYRADPDSFHLSTRFDGWFIYTGAFLWFSFVGLAFYSDLEAMELASLLATAAAGLVVLSAGTVWASLIGIFVSAVGTLLSRTGDRAEEDDFFLQRVLGFLILVVGAVRMSHSSLGADFSKWTTGSADFSSDAASAFGVGLLFFGLLLQILPWQALRASLSESRPSSAIRRIPSFLHSMFAASLLCRLFPILKDTVMEQVFFGVLAAMALLFCLFLGFVKSPKERLFLAFEIGILFSGMNGIVAGEPGYFLSIWPLLAFAPLVLLMKEKGWAIHPVVRVLLGMAALGCFGWISSDAWMLPIVTLAKRPVELSVFGLVSAYYLTLVWSEFLRPAPGADASPPQWSFWVLVGFLALVSTSAALTGSWGGGILPGEGDRIGFMQSFGATHFLKTLYEWGDIYDPSTLYAVYGLLILFSAGMGWLVRAQSGDAGFGFSEKMPKLHSAIRNYFGLRYAFRMGAVARKIHRVGHAVADVQPTRALETPSRFAQWIQNGNIQWYVVFGIGFLVISLVHVMIAGLEK